MRVRPGSEPDGRGSPPRETGHLLPALLALLLFSVILPAIPPVPASAQQQTPPRQDDATILKNKVKDLVEQVRGRDEELALRRATIAKQRFMLSSAFLFAALLAVSLAVFRVRERARREELRCELARAQQQALSLQMNPHFIFNTLGSLQSFILKNDRDASNLYLTKFSQLMRKTLSYVESEFVDLEEEVEAIRLFIELQHMRFGDHFEYEIAVDPGLDPTSVQIPPLLIQPYVENAIRHGLLPGESRGRLAVAVKVQGTDVVWIVEDNGVGRGQAEKTHDRKGRDVRPHGTEIARRRIDLLNRIRPESYSVTTVDLRDGNGRPAGTRVEILLQGQAR